MPPQSSCPESSGRHTGGHVAWLVNLSTYKTGKSDLISITVEPALNYQT